jgi:hypothetical protein
MEFARASHDHGELSYFFLEGAAEGFPDSAWTRLSNGPFTCLEAFPLGDHICGHILAGCPPAISEFRRLSKRMIGLVPVAFQQNNHALSESTEVKLLNAILSLDWTVGVKRHGSSRIQTETTKTDGTIERAFCAFLPCGPRLDQKVLVPDSLRDGLRLHGKQLIAAVRFRTIYDVFAATGSAIDQLLLRQRMPPYFDRLQPTYMEMVKLVWEVEDLVTAVENAGLAEANSKSTLGTDGDCGFMMAACGVKRYLNWNGTPWSEFHIDTRGWRWSVTEALNFLGQVMGRVFTSQGWRDFNRISISNDRRRIPKVDAAVVGDLLKIAELLRKDGLEVLPRDSISLGTPSAVHATPHPRVVIDEIDSFSNVLQVKPRDVADLIDDNGRLNLPEDDVQRALEQILNEPFHKTDWGGEDNDLYTMNVMLAGKRVAAAFALNGPGKSSRLLHIKHCGHNGDQIVRLFRSPAQLFVIQSVGTIGEDVAQDVEDKAMLRQHRGLEVHYCIINGQETARLLRAYGKI